MSASAYNLLVRAAPLIRVPTAPAHMPEVVADGSGLCRDGTNLSLY